MDASLNKLLSELRADVPSTTKDAGRENMREVVLRRGCDPKDVVDFLNAAADIWLGRAALVGSAPATFYAWYDEMAGQLRVSLVSGTTEALPFSGPIELVSSPHPVVIAALATWAPGLIPASELADVEWEEPRAYEGSLSVWCRTGGAG
jgi:hypothetical protein